jgi:DNA-directed RNA polymerase beta subunit
MFLADLPLMTDHGTFIINGIERVIVPQLARSYGVFFTSQELKGKTYFGAKIIPARGAWIEIDTDADHTIYVRMDRKRKFPVTSLLRVFGAETDTEIKALFKDNALAAPLSSIAFQLQYYFSWCQNEPISEKQARRRGRAVMRKYSSTVDHP